MKTTLNTVKEERLLLYLSIAWAIVHFTWLIFSNINWELSQTVAISLFATIPLISFYLYKLITIND